MKLITSTFELIKNKITSISWKDFKISSALQTFGKTIIWLLIVSFIFSATALIIANLGHESLLYYFLKLPVLKDIGLLSLLVLLWALLRFRNHDINDLIPKIRSQKGMWTRFTGIVIAILFGLVFASSFYMSVFNSSVSDFQIGESIQFFLFLSGLFLFAILWAFRTYDNNERELFKAIGLLGDKDKSRTAMILLMHLKHNKKVFIKEIDQATSGFNFSKTNFSNLDLREVNFSKSVLRATNLRGADLRGANLRGIDFQSPPSSLESYFSPEERVHGALNSKADFSKAIYDSKTKFDEGFDPKSKGMIFKEDDE